MKPKEGGVEAAEEAESSSANDGEEEDQKVKVIAEKAEKEPLKRKVVPQKDNKSAHADSALLGEAESREGC